MSKRCGRNRIRKLKEQSKLQEEGNEMLTAKLKYEKNSSRDFKQAWEYVKEIVLNTLDSDTSISMLVNGRKDIATSNPRLGVAIPLQVVGGNTITKKVKQELSSMSMHEQIRTLNLHCLSLKSNVFRNQITFGLSHNNDEVCYSCDTTTLRQIPTNILVNDYAQHIARDLVEYLKRGTY